VAARRKPARAKTTRAKARTKPRARTPRKRASAPQPPELLQLILGYWIAQLVHVAAQLDLADVLAKGALTPEELARRVGADPAALRRVLRGLASVGVFAQDAQGRYALTPMARTLQSDHPASLRDFARMMVDDYNWNAWGGLLQSVRDGEQSFERVHGMPFFDYLQRHPEKERVFAASMASISGTENPAIARAYPFGKLARLVDVGGAHGHLLATILRRHKKLRGVLYDQPQVVSGAPARGFVSAPDVRERVEIAGGDFFASVPTGADGYLMKYILHDWTDAQCRGILGHCRDAMAPGGRVLAVDHVIPKGNGEDWAKLMDVNMLVLPGGRERTREEFADLFASAGLRLARVWKTACPLHVLEAVRA